MPIPVNDLNLAYSAINSLSAIASINRNSVGSVNNILNSATSAIGIASTLASSLSSTGLSPNSVGNFVAYQTNSLISGGDPFFNNDSNRTQENALINRNFAAQFQSNPDEKIEDSEKKEVGLSDVVFPNPPAQHYIRFDFSRYKRLGPFSDTKLDLIDSVILPLPDQIMDPSSVQWQENQLGIMGNTIDYFRSSNTKYGAAEGADTGVAAIQSLIEGASELGAILGPVGSAIGGAISSVGEAVKNPVLANMGIAQNPVLAQMFSGMYFRAFGFQWTLSARNEKESDNLKEIIRRFKYHSLPNFTSTLAYYFNYPDIVKPSFSSAISPNLTPFKYCIIKNVSVNYNGAGTPAFYKTTNAPVVVQLSIELEEMEYVTRQDYGESKLGNAIGKELFEDISKTATSSVNQENYNAQNLGVLPPGGY